ncbi:MAG TPA: hypothetical protein VER33_13790 [Polyangiaceae bacterium]|nr:hypothetical protein [Polyangiaceae bacterium]
MRNLWVPAMTLALVACGAGSDEPDAGKVGNLGIALTGVDGQGQEYRLRSASFEISGYPDHYDESPAAGAGGTGTDPTYYTEVVSSDEEPDAATISRRLLPGYYYVYMMNTDWYLERLLPGGPERVEQAILLSPRQTYAYIWDGSSRTVSYRFGVDGELIDFRSGQLDIAIIVEQPNEGGGAGGEAGWGGTAGVAGRPPIGGAAGAAGEGGAWAY